MKIPPFQARTTSNTSSHPKSLAKTQHLNKTSNKAVCSLQNCISTYLWLLLYTSCNHHAHTVHVKCNRSNASLKYTNFEGPLVQHYFQSNMTLSNKHSAQYWYFKNAAYNLVTYCQLEQHCHYSTVKPHVSSTAHVSFSRNFSYVS